MPKLPKGYLRFRLSVFPEQISGEKATEPAPFDFWVRLGATTISLKMKIALYTYKQKCYTWKKTKGKG
jgi:hypothetical protein